MIGIGILLLIQLFAKSINKNSVYKFLEFYGANSITVLCVHPIFLNVFSFTIGNKFKNIELLDQIVVAFVVLGYLIITSVLMIRFFKKKFRWAVGS